MGKRGPQASGGYGDKTAVLSTRITGDLRQSLEDAAATSGRSLSSEIEHRLRRSFDDDRVIDQLGGQQLYAILRTVAATMSMAGTGWVSELDSPTDPPVDWLNDPYGYERAFWAVVTVLDAMRPPGDLSEDEVLSRLQARYGKGFANFVLDEIAEAPPVLATPQDQLSNTQRTIRRIASELSPARRDNLKDRNDGTR